MHLAFITSLVPVAEPASGFDIANRVIVDALRAAGHTVSVIGFLQPGAAPHRPGETQLLGTREVTNARVGIARKIGWLITAFVRREPVSVAKMHAAGAAQFDRAVAALGPVDAFILNSVQLPGAFLDRFARRPFVFVAHNVEARSAADNARNAASPVEAFLFRREARLLEGIERRLCANAFHVFTLADSDRAELGVLAPGKSSVLPLVTAVAPPPAPAPRQARYDIGMIGSWTWAANRAGLDWFLREVVPLLPADFSIAIAGGIDSKPENLPPNIAFVGRVPDARAFVRSARVVPLVSRIGTGVQLKTIETFEMGLPAVATPNALRGIAGAPENCETAESPADFAAALARLVTRSRSGETLDCDGRRFHARQMEGLARALAKGLAQRSEQG